MARVFWNSSWIVVFTILSTQVLAGAPEVDKLIDLTQATVVTRTSMAGDVERTAEQVLVEEVQKRTGLMWQQRSQFPATGPAIVLAAQQPDSRWSETYPARKGQDLMEKKPEGFRVVVTRRASGGSIVWIMGGDGPGTLYGTGQFLRLLQWEKNTARFPHDVDMASAPKYPIRGHQLGYRPRANSYDGWSVAQYEQYIRDLSLFGCNAIENIPASETDRHKMKQLMAVPPTEMHRSLSRICARYGMAYWLWMPATVDLNDAKKRAELLRNNEVILRGCSHLTGVFVPGGDPGDNAPERIDSILAGDGQTVGGDPSERPYLVFAPGFQQAAGPLGLRLSPPPIADLVGRSGRRSIEPTASGVARGYRHNIRCAATPTSPTTNFASFRCSGGILPLP